METSYYSKDMEEYVTVVDVYDSAALIGKDFEYLIEQYGVEAVTDLMPKVIRVLEQLEFLASKNEKENEEMLQMEATIRKLNSDKEERNRERQRYEQELEQIEESYRKETKDLYQMVANLQEQNKRLQSHLTEKSVGQEEAVEKTQEDLNVIQSLKETVAKQRGQIKGLQSDIKQKDNEIETMQCQVERLSHDNATLHLASNLSQTKSDRLLAEHITLQNTIKEKDHLIINIRDKISQQEKMQSQVTHMTGVLRDTRVMTHIKTMQAKHLINEKTELQTLLQDRDQQLKLLTVHPQDDQTTSEDRSHLIGQMVGNVKDPDNPRFTLNELKDVLAERNTLKSKLIEIEEELSYYKSRDKKDDTTDSSWQTEEQGASFPQSLEDSYTGEVQGPINREPWEKLHDRPESGIRKFFERFPVELPETIRVNIVPGELASYAQARASSFWDLRMMRSGTAKQDPKEGQERPKSFILGTSEK